MQLQNDSMSRTRLRSSNLFSFATALLAAGLFADRAQAQVVFVDADAPGGIQNGSSWSTAYTDLSAALATLNPGLPAEIWVGEGVYVNPSEFSSFQLYPSWEMYGGFVGFDPTGTGGFETSVAGRQGTAANTILSGDVTGSNQAVPGNCEHVVRIRNNAFFGTPGPTVLDRFRIQYGYADTPSIAPWSRQGGGVSIGNGVDYVEARLSNLQVRDNFAVFGGGLASLGNAILEVRRSVFRDNLADVFNGGGGGAMFLSRAGIGFGGGQTVGASIYNCRFFDNTAWNGGAVYIDQIETAKRVTFGNCLMHSNIAFSNGSGIYLANARRPNGTAPLGDLEITHTTIADNVSGLYLDDQFPNDVTDPDVTVRVRSSILDGNSSLGQFFNIYGPEAAQASVSYSDVELGSGVWPGAGNINTDPLFVNAAANNYRLSFVSPCIDAADDTPLLSASMLGLGDLTDLDGDGIRDELLMFALGNTVREFNIPTVPNTGLNAAGSLGGISDMGCYEAVIRNIRPL